VQQLLELCAVLPGAAILDVGCGLGRHSIELARLGFRVTGVDMNADYIVACRERTAELGLKAEFFAADSRVMRLKVRADLSISLWSSFGYYGEAGDRQILRTISEHTKRGGHVIVDVENREYIVKHFVPEEWHEHEHELVLEKRRFDVIDGTVSTRRVVLSEGKRREYRRVLRMYTVAELAALLKAVGLRPQRWCGDYDGSRFGPESKRMIAVAER
jgi:SAM-dependent methyltransferase